MHVVPHVKQFPHISHAGSAILFANIFSTLNFSERFQISSTPSSYHVPLVHSLRLNVVRSRSEVNYSDRKRYPCFDSRRNDIPVIGESF